MTTRNMTRADWLAERKTGIGGSDAAAVLGLSPWRTPAQVWLDKTNRAPDKPETEAMRIGTELEDYVARSYERETGRTVRRYTTMLRDPSTVLIGNIDRLVVPDGEKIASHQSEIRTDTLLECKTASRDWPDGVPLYYQVQVQHYMGLAPMVLHADVACLNLLAKAFSVYRIERDDEAIKAMQERLRAWWTEYVEGDKMPPPANEADCKLLWARSNPGKTVDGTAETDRLVDEYRAAKAEADRIDETLHALKDRLCAAFGDGETLLGYGSGVALATYKSAKDRAVTDWEAVARELGATDAAIAAHTTMRPGARTLRVKPAK